MFEMTISPVIEVCKKYRHGVRGMLKSQTHYLVSRYLDVESHFQVDTCFSSKGSLMLYKKDVIKLLSRLRKF